MKSQAQIDLDMELNNALAGMSLTQDCLNKDRYDEANLHLMQTYRKLYLFVKQRQRETQ